jgi:hypothetical protein
MGSMLNFFYEVNKTVTYKEYIPLFIFEFVWMRVSTNYTVVTNRKKKN